MPMLHFPFTSFPWSVYTSAGVRLLDGCLQAGAVLPAETSDTFVTTIL